MKKESERWLRRSSDGGAAVEVPGGDPACPHTKESCSWCGDQSTRTRHPPRTRVIMILWGGSRQHSPQRALAAEWRGGAPLGCGAACSLVRPPTSTRARVILRHKERRIIHLIFHGKELTLGRRMFGWPGLPSPSSSSSPPSH